MPFPEEGQAVVFGASGGIGSALCRAIARRFPGWCVHAGARQPPTLEHPRIAGFTFDLAEETSIAEAMAHVSEHGPADLVLVATGVLHSAAYGPEKSWRALDAQTMAEVFAINTIGPALIAKHALPALRQGTGSAFAALGARVGSIADNRLGGWHSYRASKAALAMLMRNFAIELARRDPAAIAVAIHPGTVDTPLSRPFQSNVPERKLFTADYSAERILDVIGGLTAKDSGGHFAWDGTPVPA